MIDFHTHILPAVDDGSSSVGESISLLEMLKEQGVDKVIATPHFDPRADTPDEFLKRRNEAMRSLAGAIGDMDLPEIVLGAEVSYFYGISRTRELSFLRIEGTKLLLIEMPMSPWSDAMIRELIELAAYRDFKPVLAHVERYVRLVPDKAIGKLLDSGILLQINASLVNEKRTRRMALRMIKNGSVHFIGSDLHGLSFRAPKIGEAGKIIENKLGDGFFTRSVSIFEKYKI